MKKHRKKIADQLNERIKFHTQMDYCAQGLKLKKSELVTMVLEVMIISSRTGVPISNPCIGLLMDEFSRILQRELFVENVPFSKSQVCAFLEKFERDLERKYPTIEKQIKYLERSGAIKDATGCVEFYVGMKQKVSKKSRNKR